MRGMLRTRRLYNGDSSLRAPVLSCKITTSYIISRDYEECKTVQVATMTATTVTENDRETEVFLLLLG